MPATSRPAQGAALAYAIYVLARNGKPVMEDLRYLADARLRVFDDAAGAGAIAAALALLGDRGRALRKSSPRRARASPRRTTRTSLTRADFGSRLRDGAGLLTLAVEGGADSAQIDKAAQVVESARDAITYASTQEESWMVLAAEALAARDQHRSRSAVDGTTHSGAYYRTWLAATLARAGQARQSGSAAGSLAADDLR